MKKLFISIFILLPFVLKAQTGSEIYVFDVALKRGAITLTNPKNITNRKGYDSQPWFHKSEPILYYTSIDDKGDVDIKKYDHKSGLTENFTQTPLKEYSPTLTPDGKYISCIIANDSNKQDLGKYPVKGGDAIVLIDNLTVGYHAWVNNEEVLIFVLGPNNTSTLHRYNTVTKQDETIAQNPGRSLHRIPGQNAISFVQIDSTSAWKIMRYDIATKAISEIGASLPAREDLTWTKDGAIIMSDGAKLFWYKPGKSTAWTEIKTESYSFMKGVTRLAIDKKNKRLAVVVSE